LIEPPAFGSGLWRTYDVEMINLLVAKARKGNVPSMIAVLERGFGKPEVAISGNLKVTGQLFEGVDHAAALMLRATLAELVEAPQAEAEPLVSNTRTMTRL
jgi:hypothetical protein